MPLDFSDVTPMGSTKLINDILVICVQDTKISAQHLMIMHKMHGLTEPDATDIHN